MTDTSHRPRTRAWAYVDTASPPPQDRQVMAVAACTEIVGGLPCYRATTSPATHCVATGLALLDRVVVGRFGDTVREALSYNGGHTLIGFVAVTDDGYFYVAHHDPDLDPSCGPLPGGVDIDEDTATRALLVAAADSPRQWFGPFDSRALAEPFVLGRAAGTGLLTLTPPPVPDEGTRETLLGQLSADQIAGIGSSLVGGPANLEDDYDLLAVHELLDEGCQVVLVRDVRGLYAFVCGDCEHGDFADCPHPACPAGYCDRWDQHKIGFSFDRVGAVAWHRTRIGR